MFHRLSPIRRTAWVMALAACGLAVVGCETAPKKAEKPRYPTQPLRDVPPWMERSVMQYTDLGGTQPFVVQGFGLVVNCDAVANAKIEPGSQRYPTNVREYMLREMALHSVGNVNNLVGDKLSPSKMLADPKNSIVSVRAMIPPGARKDRSVDIEVVAIPGSVIESLARGELYECQLAERGGDYRAPNSAIHKMAIARGPVFVSPAMAIDKSKGTRAERTALQQGVVMDGGVVTVDRPLLLQLRIPQRSLARQIEWRIDAAFQDTKTAAAQDEGIVHVFVPDKYKDDWQHFAGVVMHLYLNDSENFVVRQATILVNEAQRPGAQLQDISYCWEGLGPKCLNTIKPLMYNQDQDVAFAAARAAAFLGDFEAQDVLVKIAQTPKHKFQINAVTVLGSLPSTPEINQKMRPLLDSPENLVRIEAYRMLARNHDWSVITRVVAKGNEKFVLDVVPAKGTPMIYATRVGMPRIALIGPATSLKTPLVFGALDNRLTISADDQAKFVNIYYRGVEVGQPVQILSHPELAQVIARLGGDGPVEDAKLDFGYGDVVAMLQSLAESRKVVASVNGREVNPTFVLQEIQAQPDQIRSAPLLPGQVRPQSDAPGAQSRSQ